MESEHYGAYDAILEDYYEARETEMWNELVNQVEQNAISVIEAQERFEEYRDGLRGTSE